LFEKVKENKSAVYEEEIMKAAELLNAENDIEAELTKLKLNQLKNMRKLNDDREHMNTLLLKKHEQTNQQHNNFIELKHRELNQNVPDIEHVLK